MTTGKNKSDSASNKAVRTSRAFDSVYYLLVSFLFATVVAGAQPCFAQYDQGDGVYGRLNDDTIFSYGAGFGLDTDASQTFVADLRARYLDSAGVVVAPEIRTNGEPAIGVAVEIRPIFLARFLTNNYFGRSWEDLTIDSMGVELGSWFGPLDQGAGVALLAGVGVDLPLNADGASGLWFRLGARWIYAHERDIESPEGGVSKVVIMAVLYFRSAVDLDIARWEPPRYTRP